MEYRTTVKIPIKDIRKLMKNKMIKSIRQLSVKAKVEYTYLAKCFKGNLVMSEETWNKIKKFL